VCRLSNFAGFVEVAEGVEGMCHFSEVPGYAGRRGAEPPLAIGQEGSFKILKMNEAEKKIGLSLRAAAEAEEKGRLDDYQRQAAAAISTIEEVMSLKDRSAE
jgi:small subunit ribosomal protein S1